MGIRLSIFDMDGVLVDSEPLHDIVRVGILTSLANDKNAALGFDPVGTDTEQYYDAFLRARSLPGSGADVAKRHYAEVYERVLSTLPGLIGGVPETLERLRRAGVRCAVASSSPRFFVRGLLERYGVAAYFDAFVTADDVINKKPAPDCYRLALERASVPAAEAVALEDSAAGLKAATRAGIRCAAYVAPGARYQDMTGAWKTVGSMRAYADLVLTGEMV